MPSNNDRISYSDALRNLEIALAKTIYSVLEVEVSEGVTEDGIREMDDLYERLGPLYKHVRTMRCTHNGN